MTGHHTKGRVQHGGFGAPPRGCDHAALGHRDGCCKVLNTCLPTPVMLRAAAVLWVAGQLAATHRTGLCLTLLQVLYEESKGDAIVTTGVGQHQMWAAQVRAQLPWVSLGVQLGV